MIEKFYTARDGAQISVLYFASENVNAPLIFEIHGGGYFAGHHYDDIPLCTEIGELLDCNVASVEYRYAPEVTFPVAAYDCADALSGLICDSSLDFDRTRIAVWGHSAGANAAAAMLQMCSGLCGAVLSYPWLDATDRRRPYVFGGMPYLYMRHMAHKYFNNKELRSTPIASPVFMKAERLRSLPPVLILACGKDTLREDALRFCNAFSAAGGKMRVRYYPEAEHGFIEVVSAGRIKNRLFSRRRCEVQTECYKRAIADVCTFLGKLFRGDF